MNNLLGIKKLKNRYFIMRHGEAESNTCRIIVGNPKVGIKKFGLTELGKLTAAKNLKRFKGLNRDTIIYSSDFLRAKQTAIIAANLLKIKKINYTAKLRERNFGDLEGGSVKNFYKIWLADGTNLDHKINGVESANEVMNRVTQLVKNLEKKYKNKNILLVSHGDPLQILAVAFLKKPASYYTKTRYIKKGAIKKLTLK